MYDVGAATTVTLHPLAIRASDDDPDTFVVGRAEGGGFAELPTIGVEALRLLGGGMSVEAVERQLTRGADRPDVAGLLCDLVGLNWVAALDGARLPDPVGVRKPQVRWLLPRHLSWLFSRPTAVGCAVLAAAAAVTVARRPDQLPTYRDFFWTSYVGLATLVNIGLFAAGGAVHELMHLAAARSLGLPARIGLGTRLYNLVLQTNVSAAWAVPRRQRYRIYLAGMAWDGAASCAAFLICAYCPPPAPVHRLLASYILIAVIGLTLQAQIFMRTDLYFVVMDLLRCGDLFHDGLGYARYLSARAMRAVWHRPAPPDPTRHLPAKERKAVRIYAPLAAACSALALAAYGFFFIPVLIDSSVRAISEIAALSSGGSVGRAVEDATVLAAEWSIEVLFLVVFYRSHPAWFGRGIRANSRGGDIA